jgi:uncharacterized surface protein with fasciclin (FAS1) repeats
MTPKRFLAALAAVFAISVAQTSSASSCGGGDHDHSHGEGYTVMDKAAADGNFSTLIAAVEAAGLQEVLTGHGPFTIFAPTNAAFAALPEGTVESLLMPENIDQLKAILTYHVVPKNVMSSQIRNGDNFVKTVGGSTLNVEKEYDEVMIGSARVVAVDIKASNGVIHVIDEVLLPKS